MSLWCARTTGPLGKKKKKKQALVCTICGVKPSAVADFMLSTELEDKPTIGFHKLVPAHGLWWLRHKATSPMGKDQSGHRQGWRALGMFLDLISPCLCISYGQQIEVTQRRTPSWTLMTGQMSDPHTLLLFFWIFPSPSPLSLPSSRGVSTVTLSVY